MSKESIDVMALNFASLYQINNTPKEIPTKGVITTGNKANRKKGKAQKQARKRNR